MSTTEAAKAILKAGPNPGMPSILVDSREQLPYRFDGAIVRGLQTGDYSLDGLENLVAVERKSKADLYGSLGQGRDRFRREMERLSRMAFAALVVECSWADLLRPPKHSRMSPYSVRGSLVAWSVRFNVHVFCVADRQAGGAMTLDLLTKFWREHQRTAQLMRSQTDDREPLGQAGQGREASQTNVKGPMRSPCDLQEGQTP